MAKRLLMTTVVILVLSVGLFLFHTFSQVNKDTSSDEGYLEQATATSVQTTKDLDDLESKIRQQEFPDDKLDISELKTKIKYELIEEIELKERLAHHGLVTDISR